MLKPFYIVCFFLCFTACSGYRMLEGRSKPVLLTPDTTVFTDPYYPKPTVYYSDLFNLRGNLNHTIALEPTLTSQAIVHEPTFFHIQGEDSPFLVYPGEAIIIKKNAAEEFVFSTADGNLQRDKELLFFQRFYQLERYPTVPQNLSASLETVIMLEREQLQNIKTATSASKALFDSLRNVYGVSKKFKKLTSDYLDKRYYESLFWLYRFHRDTLQSYHLYSEKCKRLIPLFNSVKSRVGLRYMHNFLNDVVLEILPKFWVRTEAEFQHCFDSVESLFSGVSRDYLLSRLMYRAYTAGIPVTNHYLEKYKDFSHEKQYRRVVRNAMKQRKKFEDNLVTGNDNGLLAVDGKRIYDLDSVLSSFKGKYVLIDFWATWCVPCKRQMPFWKSLQKKYVNDSIVFLSLSIDKEVQLWQKAIIASGAETFHHYLLMNPDSSSFTRQFNINTIPRYMLLDREGNIVDPDAPLPSDPALNDLLNRLLSRF